jgi:hypothetical protein
MDRTGETSRDGGMDGSMDRTGETSCDGGRGELGEDGHDGGPLSPDVTSSWARVGGNPRGAMGGRVKEGKTAVTEAGAGGVTAGSTWPLPSSPKPTTLRDDESFESAVAWHSSTAK